MESNTKLDACFAEEKNERKDRDGKIKKDRKMNEER